MTPGDPEAPPELSPRHRWSPTAVVWTYLAWVLAPFITVLVAGPQAYYLVVLPFYLATAIFLARYWYRLSWSDLGIPGEDPWWGVKVSIVLAGGYLLFSFAVVGLYPSDAVSNLLNAWRVSKLQLITQLLFGPIVEELFFRGVAFQVVARRYNVNRAILVTSLLFSAYHLSPANAPILFLLGLVLGWFMREPGSTLLTPIILHTTFNLWGKMLH